MAAETGTVSDGEREPHSTLARAKVNLCLHVTGRRADGYHLLESLVVFPELGDRLSAEPASGLSLSIDGPFGQELGAGADNLVLRAAQALQSLTPAARPLDARPLDARALDVRAIDARPFPGAALRLEKHLPIASGIGGGSADAAAALTLLRRLWSVAPTDAQLSQLALTLGADVPVCLASRPAIMAGIGEVISPAPLLPPFWMLLVNPGVAVATPDIFRALSRRENPPLPDRPARFEDLSALTDWLATTRNDLEPPAIALQPVIAEALAALRADPACRLARMSGSGATCWGLYEDERSALDCADRLRAARPGWWVAAAPATRS